MYQTHRNNQNQTGSHWKVHNRSGELLYAELTSKIIELCYETHHQYGSGQKESVYQNVLEEKMTIKKMPFKKEVPIPILSMDTGKKIGSHRLDFVVDEKVIIELKAIKFTPIKLEQQLYSYLRNSPYSLGLMLNFGSSKLFIRRIILTL